MGNCEACHTVDRKASTSLALQDGTTSDQLNSTPKLYDLPESCPWAVKETYRKLGPFQAIDLSGIEIPPPVELENGVTYQGQWVNNQRSGYGRQIWSDGSVYEGLWADNMANGEGRLIHSGGDVY